MNKDALKSVLGHAIVGFVGGLGLVLVGWVQANPDPAAWTSKAFGTALFVGLVASVKKLIAGELLN